MRRCGGLGYHISDSTVANVLRQNGIEPAPNRKRQTTWSLFLKAHWDVIAAIGLEFPSPLIGLLTLLFICAAV